MNLKGLSINGIYMMVDKNPNHKRPCLIAKSRLNGEPMKLATFESDGEAEFFLHLLGKLIGLDRCLWEKEG